MVEIKYLTDHKDFFFIYFRYGRMPASENMNIHKIVASCDVDKKAWERIMIKYKMKKELELRKQRYQNGN